MPDELHVDLSPGGLKAAAWVLAQKDIKTRWGIGAEDFDSMLPVEQQIYLSAAKQVVGAFFKGAFAEAQDKQPPIKTEVVEPEETSVTTLKLLHRLVNLMRHAVLNGRPLSDRLLADLMDSIDATICKEEGDIRSIAQVMRNMETERLR